MIELYWISILDPLCRLITAAFILSLIIVIISSAFIFSNEYEPEYSESFIKSIKDLRKKCLIILGISSILVVFVPTSKDAYMIYGVGGTIDYLQSNETAKKLPDKCIKALDKFVSEYSDSIQ